MDPTAHRHTSIREKSAANELPIIADPGLWTLFNAFAADLQLAHQSIYPSDQPEQQVPNELDCATPETHAPDENPPYARSYGDPNTRVVKGLRNLPAGSCSARTA
jgi:hypothetical protein